MMTLVLRRPVIAITGSSGKTTTKEMIASVLQQQLKVFKSKANYNMPRYMPQYANQIRSYHKAVVLEYGMSRSGHLRKSCKIIKPNMVVITMIGTAHIGNVGGTAAGLINAKSEIILNMKQSGTLFINKDDVNSKRLNTRKFNGAIVTIGIKNSALYRAHAVRYTEQGMKFAVNLAGKNHEFFIPILGTHNIYNALYAIAVADRLGFSPEQIKKGLKRYVRLASRLRVFHLKRNICLIDDTYNANPNSVKAAIDVLSRIGKGKNIAVLGTMSELGRYSMRGHKEVGRYLAKSKVTHLFTFGKAAKLIGTEAVSNGFLLKRVIHSISRNTMHQRLKRTISPGSTVLVKGSHIMRMNKTVRFIFTNKK